MNALGINDPMASRAFTLRKNSNSRGIGWERIDGQPRTYGTLKTAFFA